MTRARKEETSADFHLLGDLQTLRKFLEKHVNIAIEKGDQAKEGTVYGFLGMAYFSHSDFRKAIEYHEKHLKIAIAIGDRAGEGRAYGNLGTA